MLALILIAIIVIITYLINEIRKPPNFPPGPNWMPFVGSLPELKSLSKVLGGQHLALSELSKRHKTNVLGLKLGRQHVIAVFSYPVIRQVLTSDVYNARPDNFFLRLRCMGTRNGVTCTDGDFHATQRNFVIRHLRNLGFGKRTMELMIRDEIAEILTVMEECQSGLQIGNILAPAVLNILWALTSGCRFSRQDPQLEKLLDLLEKRSKAFDMSGGTLSQYPWMRFISPEKCGFSLIQNLNRELKKLLMGTINDHYRTWKEGKDDDLIYSFISEMRKTGDLSTTFTNDQLVMVCLDIFIAGSQTTSNTLDFAFLMMILHPDIQSKVQEHIDEYLDKNISLQYSDRQKVPYVEAVLMEVERYCNVVPVIGPRRLLQDTVLDNYIIPKDTTVLISVHSVHYDKEFWKDPEVFRPERFLDNGKLIAQDRILTFGLGRRRCLGEALARSCIFLFFVEIIRKFSVDLVPGSQRPSGKPLPGITLSPERYNAVFIKR